MRLAQHEKEALRVIAGRPQGMDASTVASRIGWNRRSVGTKLLSLEKRGLLTREYQSEWRMYSWTLSENAKLNPEWWRDD